MDGWGAVCVCGWGGGGAGGGGGDARDGPGGALTCPLPCWVQHVQGSLCVRRCKTPPLPLLPPCSAPSPRWSWSTWWCASSSAPAAPPAQTQWTAMSCRWARAQGTTLLALGTRAEPAVKPRRTPVPPAVPAAVKPGHPYHVNLAPSARAGSDSLRSGRAVCRRGRRGARQAAQQAGVQAGVPVAARGARYRPPCLSSVPHLSAFITMIRSFVALLSLICLQPPPSRPTHSWREARRGPSCLQPWPSGRRGAPAARTAG